MDDDVPEGTEAWMRPEPDLVNYRPNRLFTVDGIAYDFRWQAVGDGFHTVRPMFQLRRCNNIHPRHVSRHRPDPPPTDEELDEWVREGRIPSQHVTIPQQRSLQRWHHD
jgi:hypothetical protein